MKHSISLFFALFMSVVLVAQQRSMEEVMRIASQFVPQKTEKRLMPSRQVLSQDVDNDAFYVVKNTQGKGFVIVSADVRMPAVLGFSYDEDYPDENMPEHIKAVLASYSDGLNRLQAGEDVNVVFPQFRLKNAQDTVGPLLGDIKYDQGYPYNALCPKVGGTNCVTGCIATAMAQIMRYYSYPQCGTGVFTVASSGKSTQVDISKMPFDWDNILPTYEGKNYTAAQAEAVATLMYACGASVNMNYGVDGSGTQSNYVRPALVNNFFFSSTARYVEGEGTDPNQKPYFDWIPTLMDQFQKGHPVYFAGAPGGAGHAFVLDGYTGAYVDDVEDVYFHVNWGWSGSMNGYFYLNNLNPDGTNYAGFRSEWVFNIFPDNWTSVDVVRTTRTDGKIYNLLGVEVREDMLQPNTIYISNGKKFIW